MLKAAAHRRSARLPPAMPASPSSDGAPTALLLRWTDAWDHGGVLRARLHRHRCVAPPIARTRQQNDSRPRPAADVRPEQIEANKTQLGKLVGSKIAPTWLQR